jgi:hypothetical protein
MGADITDDSGDLLSGEHIGEGRHSSLASQHPVEREISVSQVRIGCEPMPPSASAMWQAWQISR